MDRSFIDRLKDKLDEDRILIDEPMRNHTTFKVGGPADVLVMPENAEEISSVIGLCREKSVPFMILGNGSNLLVRDGGIRGVVIKIADKMSTAEVEGDTAKVQAGALMSRVSKVLLDNSLKGFEFASGIPGTIGGAVTMNAGAYGGEMKDIIYSVECLTSEGEIKVYSNEEMNFGYRKSRVQEDELTVLSVVLKLESGSRDDIKAAIDELTEKRTTKQPLELASAGSTFKRPEGYFAGKLIEDSGLRGIRYRNVGVSEKHCGFVVNYGNSKAEDVICLIGTVQKTVYDKFGVKLETEVKIIGEE